MTNQKSLDKNKPKELKCIEDLIKTGWKVLYFKIKGDNLDVVGENGVQLLNYFEETLTQQRTELLEEIKTRIDTWGGFEDDGGNLCHYDSEILEWVNDLLNNKNE